MGGAVVGFGFGEQRQNLCPEYGGKGMSWDLSLTM